MAVRVEFHPRFAGQYEALAELAQTSEAQWDLFAEVTALVNALEEHGHGIEEDNHHPDAISHPIVTSRFHTFALRRTPPTKVTPYADRPPVLRIPYVWFTDTETVDEVAVVMLAGDKTALGNGWYPASSTRSTTPWSESGNGPIRHPRPESGEHDEQHRAGRHPRRRRHPHR